MIYRKVGMMYLKGGDVGWTKYPKIFIKKHVLCGNENRGYIIGPESNVKYTGHT